MEKIGVTIITGFLGSGKTTLLNNIIDKYDKKFSIIENEFGDINIDSELIVDAQDGIFELSNGCICCNLNAELEEVLTKLLKSKFTFNHLLVETTGVADPIGVVNSLLTDHLQQKYYIDSIICLIDTVSFSNVIQDVEVVVKQLAASNIAILNKIDMVTQEAIDNTSKLIKSVNPTVEIINTSFCNIENAEILDRAGFKEDEIFSQMQEVKIGNSEHIDIFNSVSIVQEYEYDLEDFQSALNRVIHKYKDSLYRFKGIINVFDIAEPIIIQTVGDRIAATKSTKPKQNESKLVFIGKEIDKKEIEELFSTSNPLRPPLT